MGQGRAAPRDPRVSAPPAEPHPAIGTGRPNSDRSGPGGAGLADWWCHRRTDIEHTAGARESMIHAAVMLEGGLPTMLGLFCEVNAGVLAITYTTLGLHELTAIWDVAYADGRREVTPTEQHIHGFLERVPLMAEVLLTVPH